MKYIFIVLVITLLTCSNKQVNNENEAQSLNNLLSNDIIENSNILFVNASNGLRIRDEPSLSGNRIDLLSHNEPVFIIERSENQDIIDDIMDYWYFIESNEIRGWVFGGYLNETVEELKLNEENIIGRYIFNSIIIRKEENVYKREFHSNINIVNFEIEQIENNKYAIKHNDPLFVLFPRNLNIEFEFPPDNREYWYPSFILKYDGIPFYYYMGEMGGGGTYIYFYYNDDNIIIDYKNYSDMNGYLEEGEKELPIEWFEFNVIFEKTK